VSDPRSGRSAAWRRRRWLTTSLAALLVSVIGTTGPTVARQAGGDEVQAVESYLERGIMARRRGDLGTALAALEQAVALAPDRGDAWFQLGLARSRAGDWRGSVAAYTRAAELDPSNAKAANNLANVYFRRSNHVEAVRWYARALEIDPHYLNAAFHHGWVLRELDRPVEAERSFERCLEIAPSGPRDQKTRLDCLHYLGALRFRDRDYERAAEIMKQVVSINPDHVEAHYYLGMSYRQLGRAEQARQLLERHDKMIQVIRRRDPVERQPGR